ncbi:MAG: RagB/SusD family nutrient uptake outer membrane protein [Flammeovirgaceae bacterium]|nr:RagB/SusD family nutrient uptake outer membrane protein [Flammeovirgaceae bacterium]
MKKTKSILLSFFLLLWATIACKDDFLEVAPTASLVQAQLSSEPGLEGSLIGVYSLLLGRDGAGFYSSTNNWFWGSVRGGDANKGSDAGDQSFMNEVQAFNPQTTNGEVLNKYARTYEGIVRANSTLGLLATPEEGISAATLLRIEAETKFLRGLYYFELKKLYNNTPYIDESWDGEEEVPNDKDLYPLIEADIKFAADNLPETQSEAGRINKWGAMAYLAKVYLFQQKYADAKPLFDQVIANGVTTNGIKYGLVPKFSDIHRPANDNHEESVFAIQAAAGTGSISNANPDLVLTFTYNGGPAGCCGFFQPSFELSNSYRTSGGLPLLDGSYNNASNKLVHDLGIAADADFTPDSGPVDPRLDHTVGRRGIPYLDWGNHPGKAWIRDQNNGGAYSPKKWVFFQEDQSAYTDGSSWTAGYTAINVNLMRFADVLLMAAEIEVEIGDLEKAREYVNMIRTRAANAEGFVMDDTGAPAANYDISLYNTAWTDQATARDAVRFERKLELAMEGHRFFDLCRWGVADQVLNAYLAHEDAIIPASPFIGASFQAGVDEILPIPQDEIDLIGAEVLKQNPGY